MGKNYTWVNTPAFDRVAAEGIRFSNAYTPNSKCAPSRACLLTARNSWQLITIHPLRLMSFINIRIRKINIK